MMKPTILAVMFGLSLSACMASDYGANDGDDETGGTSAKKRPASEESDKGTGGTSSTGGSKATGGSSSKQTEEPSSACKDGDENPCPACPEKVQTCSGGTFVSCSCPDASNGDDDDDDDDDSAAATGGKTSTGGSKSTGGSESAAGGSKATGGEQSSTGGSKSTGGSSTTLTGGKSSSTGGSKATGGEQSSTGGSESTGGTSATGGTSSRVCDPGESYDCSEDCTNGGEGVTKCLSNGSGYEPCACEANHGTGGSSAGTGGTSSTGGTTSTGGSSTGGTTEPGEKHRYQVVFVTDPAHPWKNFVPSFYTEKDGGREIDFNCEVYKDGDLTVARCQFDDPGTAFRFYASTGVDGAGSWVPGREGTTGKCTAYSAIFVGRDCNPVPFAFQEKNGGCNGVVEKGGAARTDADQDNDGVTIEGGDCNDGNPSIRPPQTPDDQSYTFGTFNETCSAMGQTGTDLIRVEVPVKFVSGDMLTIMEPYASYACWADDVYNHEADVTVPGTVCQAHVDISRETEFYVRAGGIYATGSISDGDTVRFESVYVYVGDDEEPYGRYDATTDLGDFRYRITDDFISADEYGPANPPMDTSHLFLPAW